MRTATASEDAALSPPRPPSVASHLRMIALSICVLAGLGCATAAAALAHTTAEAARATTIVGDATAGKALFVSSCGTCHTLSAAGSAGTIGPNLTTTSLSETTIIDAITNGGATVMTKAQLAKYTTTMTAFKGVISTADIDDIAAFVYDSTHAAVPPPVSKPAISSFTPASAKAGTKVTVKGKDFTAASEVKVGTLKATFKLVSSTEITLTVPAKAKTGKISVTTKTGTATSAAALKVS